MQEGQDCPDNHPICPSCLLSGVLWLYGVCRGEGLVLERRMGVWILAHATSCGSYGTQVKWLCFTGTPSFIWKMGWGFDLSGDCGDGLHIKCIVDAQIHSLLKRQARAQKDEQTGLQTSYLWLQERYSGVMGQSRGRWRMAMHRSYGYGIYVYMVLKCIYGIQVYMDVKCALKLQAEKACSSVCWGMKWWII